MASAEFKVTLSILDLKTTCKFADDIKIRRSFMRIFTTYSKQSRQTFTPQT